MVAAAAVNVICAVDHKKAAKNCERFAKLYRNLAFNTRKRFWEEQGAREAEDGRFYIDLAGGLQLVIYEGKIDGWHFCEESAFEKKLKEAEHRAKVFERMAFEACEERDAAIWAIKREILGCDVCVYVKEEHPECDELDCFCEICKNEECRCRKCDKNQSEFVFDTKKVRELMRKESEKE